MAKRLTTEEFISKARSVHGDRYDYSKVVYTNNGTKVCIICPDHGEFWQMPSNHLRGVKCPKCSHKSTPYTSEEFAQVASQKHNGYYDYSKVVYVNNTTPIKIICPVHGEFWQKPINHLSGCGCQKCGLDISKPTKQYDVDELKKSFEIVHNCKYDYSKIEYVNAKTKLSIVCPIHGEFKQLLSDHIRGHGCPKCQHIQSKAELEILDFLRDLLPDGQVIEKDREILDGKEIDILLPSLHLGIEFNGLHWHNNEHLLDKNYHKQKMVMANAKGFRLIQIFEDEWIEHKDIVLNKMRHFIGADKQSKVVGGRNVVVRAITNEQSQEFLTKFHIQGFVPSSVYLGAFYKNQLVAVMTFTEEKEKMWNLTRFATDTQYRQPGVANKMFKYFCANYTILEIKSFLDLRWNQPLNNSTLYDKLGFSLNKILEPDYRYVVGKTRVHKFNCRKATLHKKYGFPLTMHEREMTKLLGFKKIYDCGLAKYIYKKNETSS